MGHQIAYVVATEGRRFNAVLQLGHRASAEELELCRETGSLWDGRFAKAPFDFSVELSGVITLVWLPEKYSRFQSDSSVRERVLAWETELAKLLPNVRRIRVDELVLQTWESNHEDFWFRDSATVESFLEWLPSQDSEGWAEL